MRQVQMTVISKDEASARVFSVPSEMSDEQLYKEAPDMFLEMFPGKIAFVERTGDNTWIMYQNQHEHNITLDNLSY